MAVKYQSAHRWPRAIKFNPYHLVLWSFLGLSQWVYVRDDLSKGLKIRSLRVINHGMSLSVLYMSRLHLLPSRISQFSGRGSLDPHQPRGGNSPLGLTHPHAYGARGHACGMSSLRLLPKICHLLKNFLRTLHTYICIKT